MTARGRNHTSNWSELPHENPDRDSEVRAAGKWSGPSRSAGDAMQIDDDWNFVQRIERFLVCAIAAVDRCTTGVFNHFSALLGLELSCKMSKCET